MTLETGVKELAEAVGADVKALADGKVDSSDPRLADSREWSAATVTQAEAEAGTASTRRAWTAQRVWQAVNAWWQLVTSGFGRNFIAASNEQAARNVLQLGTAATRNVGESSGNVMEVGAFGLGSTGANSLPYESRQSGFGYTTTNPVLERAGPFLKIHAARGFIISARGSRVVVQTTGQDDDPVMELIHSLNILTTTGQSTEYPMTQKATTDAINGVSDRRDKLDITSSGVGLDLIEKLEPVSFRLNKRDWYRKQAATSIETHTDEGGAQTEAEKINPDVIAKPLTDYDDNDGSLARDDSYTGLIAQDVKAALENLGLGDLAIIKNYSDEYEGGDDRHYIEYNGLIPVMINAIKELSARVKELEIKVEDGELSDETITRNQE